MNLIQLQINTYLRKLARGEETIPEFLVQEFADGIQKRFMRKAKARDKRFVLSISNIGKPLCQIQMEKAGAEIDETFEVRKPAKFAAGDLMEHWLIMIIKAAGCNVTGEDHRVKLNLEGIDIAGTLDIEIDHAIFDIKVVSATSFKKYTTGGGFLAVYEDDPFGYVVQGYLYALGRDKHFGGWIVLNKDTGEVVVCSTPDHDERYRREAIQKATDNLKAIAEERPFARCFTDEEEIFRKKPTGNRVLGRTCSYCPYAKACWPEARYLPSMVSTAFEKSYKYYTKVIYEFGSKKEEGDGQSPQGDQT